MDMKSSVHSHFNWWRLLLLLLIVIPFLPEIAIYAITAVAKIQGCSPKASCNVLGLSAFDAFNAIDRALSAALFRTGLRRVAGSANWDSTWLVMGPCILEIWLAACYGVVTLGWVSTRSRLSVAFAVTLLFAVLPYIGPWRAINLDCYPRGGGVGECEVFGGHLDNTVPGAPDKITANDTIAAENQFLIGAPIATGVFVIYLVVATIIGVVSRKRFVASTQGPQL